MEALSVGRALPFFIVTKERENPKRREGGGIASDFTSEAGIRSGETRF
jgi:hypothetical protein